MIRRGFTLLEVMIAIAVLAMIGGLTWKSFDGAYALKKRVETAQERDQTVRGALDRIGREVSMTFLSEHYDHKRFRERPTFFRLKDGRREALLTFTSFAHQRLHVDARSRTRRYSTTASTETRTAVALLAVPVGSSSISRTSSPTGPERGCGTPTWPWVPRCR